MTVAAAAIGLRRLVRSGLPEDDLNMADSDFYREVAAAFSGLLGESLVVESSIYSARSFGNAMVVLAEAGFRLRLSRDRGDTTAEVLCGDDPARADNWFPLEWVVAAATGSPRPTVREVTPTHAARLVTEHRGHLRDALAPTRIEATRRQLDGFARSAMRELFGDDWNGTQAERLEGEPAERDRPE